MDNFVVDAKVTFKNGYEQLGQLELEEVNPFQVTFKGFVNHPPMLSAGMFHTEEKNPSTTAEVQFLAVTSDEYSGEEPKTHIEFKDRNIVVWVLIGPKTTNVIDKMNAVVKNFSNYNIIPVVTSNEKFFTDECYKQFFSDWEVQSIEDVKSGLVVVANEREYFEW